MEKVLTISGSDSLSGGGLQADLRTFEEFNIIGENVVTCIVTVEPKTDKVKIDEVSLEMIKNQLDYCLKDSANLKAIKIGMLANIETAKVIASYLKGIKNIPIVLDPVLSLKETGLDSGVQIINFFKDNLMPLATITTPNLKEAELLSGIENIDSLEKMKKAAKLIHKTGVTYVVIKGGKRMEGPIAYDLFYDGSQYTLLEAKKIRNGYNNGAGCTFASVIASEIAKGYPIEQSVKNAKLFVYDAIENGIPFLPDLGNVYQIKKSKVNPRHNISLL